MKHIPGAKAISLWVCVIITSMTVYCQQQDPYIIRNFTKQEYKAESQNWSITMNRNGFIYGANNVGLLEFDGVEWNFYPAPNGTVIRSVAVDRLNRIFTSGYREIGFWERDRMGILEYHSLNDKAESLFSQNEEFWNTVIIGDIIYFHSFSSLFIYENEEFKVIRPDALIQSISDINGTLFLHMDGRGLYNVKDTILKPFRLQPELDNDIVHFTLQLRDSSLLIGTASEGLFLFNEYGLSPFLETWQVYFSENKINRGIIGNNGNIIIGTLLDGLLIFDQNGSLLHHINNNRGLQNNTILGMLSDKDNNIWLSLDKGIDFISFQVDPTYTFYTYEEIGAIYSAVLFKEELYLCTNQGVFYRPWEDEEAAFRIIPGTQGQAWDCGVFDEQLIVSHNSGTFRIENHMAEKISEVSGGLSVIRNPMNSDMLLQSTYSNIVFYEKLDREWRYIYQLSEFNDLIRYIEMDHLNNLWASHMHRGIFRLKLSDAQDAVVQVQYFGDSIFGRDYDVQVFKIEKRIVFTTGQQIYTFNDLNDSIIPYQQLNQDLGEYAQAHRVVQAHDHHYWFISKSGIGLFKIFDSTVTMIKKYPAGLFKDHLIAEYENIIPLSATQGLLCLDNGYAILRADQPDFSHGIEEKQLLLKSVGISGRSGKIEELPIDNRIIRIPFSKNSLTLGFAFPLISNEHLSFQSFVEGLDNQWSKPMEKPVFIFTRIPSGEYRIRIRANNDWGISSQEEEIILFVTQPWYLSKLSIMLYAVILMVSLLVGRYLLLRRIRSREQKIKEGKEKELIRLRNEKLNTELSYKSQELANSTMAIIKKNEFLLELKETIRGQKEELGTRYPEKYYARLVQKIDHNISSMDDWKVFEFHFEKAHEKFLLTLMTKYPQLSHSDLRLCAYLRMNLSSKEIAPLLRISYRGVENHRYRLRKKLLLKKEVNLTDFILAI